MSKAMFKPDAVLDGQEFSALTRFLEALHERKEAGIDSKKLDSAKEAKAALEAFGPIGEEDLKNLVDMAKAYQKAVEDDKLEQFPNVKGMELKRLVQKLEGMLSAQETELDGKKVHPAAMPPGEAPEKKPSTDADAQKVQIVDTPETLKAKENAKKDEKTPVEDDMQFVNKKK